MTTQPPQSRRLYHRRGVPRDTTKAGNARQQEATCGDRPRKEDKRMETSHISALRTKHAGLERQIEQEMARPVPDDTLLQDLKRRKLRIKEEIAQIH